MKRLIIGIILFAMGTTASQKINAQGERTPGIRHQQFKEQCRIRAGVATGELTRKETMRLEMQQAKIQHDKRCAKADGVVTPQERAILRIEQERASRNIFVEKHDMQHR
ncbi:MAG: hypothetical protein NTY88_12725 [Bacteroidetes bacterium]|nr:hypothetical protein [Bacteroidota bacterium]